MKVARPSNTGTPAETRMPGTAAELSSVSATGRECIGGSFKVVVLPKA